ncbi:MAG: CXXX repeat peptide maturase [Bacteroidales bacterium]|nr:CXXX repeat peptide maturase [Bacteroidales bacterium]
MLKYLVIVLDDTSVSYCHYNNECKEKRLIDIDTLKKGIVYAMKENLSIQYVLPDYTLPKKYVEVMESIDNIKFCSSNSDMIDEADVIVLNGWCSNINFNREKTYVLRISKEELFEKEKDIKLSFDKMSRLNVVITNITSFKDSDIDRYNDVLNSFSKDVKSLIQNGFKINILTDRIMLDAMNNCNAGAENITLAPDGCFYVCPAFYHCGENGEYGLGKTKFCIGNLEKGVDIKNSQLYEVEYAPLCRKCDAYHCKRCVWLNLNSTYEINTPSHEQCVVAHLERNASKTLLESIGKHKLFVPEKEIKEISYLDPFDIIDKL